MWTSPDVTGPDHGAASCFLSRTLPESCEASLADLFVGQAPARHVQPGETIFLHGEPADHVYCVISGTVRCCTIDRDGRRQIFRFVRQDGFLGFFEIGAWHYTAEAVDHVILRALPRDMSDRMIARRADLQGEVRSRALMELRAREQQMMVLAYYQAEERLLWFLKSFAEGRGDGFIALPMTRRDIGDYLGMTLETVSRTFGALKSRRLIEMRGRDKYRLTRDEEAIAA